MDTVHVRPFPYEVSIQINTCLSSIAECGHVFCISCLQDWFSTLLAKHKMNVPEFSLTQPIPGHLRDLSVRVRDRPELRAELDLEVARYRFSQSIPQPVYTCPTCRVIVRNKPVEIFALKSVVGTILNAMGETSPKAKSVKGKKPASVGPWDGIFPVDIVWCLTILMDVIMCNFPYNRGQIRDQTRPFIAARGSYLGSHIARWVRLLECSRSFR